MFADAQAERLELFLRLDELDLKYKKKFQDFLNLTKENVKLDSENELIKKELV